MKAVRARWSIGQTIPKGELNELCWSGIHKRYSVLVAVDERKGKLARGRISANSVHAFAKFFEALQGPGKVVLEACWNWGRAYDVLSEMEQVEQVEEVVLAHPRQDPARC